jgi:polygalacturonase
MIRRYLVSLRNWILLLIASFIAGCSAGNGDVFDIANFGAKGDGVTLNTSSVQSAIDAANAAGGGTVLFPEGVYLSGTIYLKDNVTLLLSEGAVLKGSGNLKHYPAFELTTTRSYTERYSKKAFVFAENVENITIKGKGTIDGNSRAEEFLNAGRDDENRSTKPLGIKLVSCKNVLIEDITVHSGGLWLQHYLNCDRLTIRGITAINHGHRTNDGMNVDGCKNVLIENVYIDSHDDALVFKSTGPAICKNIVVRNCVLKSHCHGLKFGTETSGGFTNIDISNIFISPSDTIIHEKPHLAKVITGIALELVDGGVMENVSVNNLRADSVYAPIFIKLGNRSRKYAEHIEKPSPGTISGIKLTNFKITNAGPFSSSVTGFPGHFVRNVILQNISITYNEAPDIDELFDSVPENETRYPEITMFAKGMDKMHYLPTYGLFVRHVDGLVLDNYNVTKMSGDERDEFQFINSYNIVR